MKNRWAVLLALACALVITAQARADSGKKKNHGNPHANQLLGDHGRHHHDDDDDDRWEHRDGYEVRVYEVREGRPPGWSRGRKTGWGDCGLPPGQAKKYGCRTYVYRERRYYYYEDEWGRVVVRRPSVHIHVNF